MSDTNILIVGAGPVGLAAALELARRGYAPRIIDQGDGFTPIGQSRALGVNNRTLQLLTPSGVTADMIASGNKVERFRIVNENGRSVIGFDFENIGAPYPYMLVLVQGKTERLLAKALNALGVEVEWNSKLVASNGDAASPSVDVNKNGAIETIKTDLLIGADGPGSAVRKEFGFRFDGEGYPVEFGLADIERGDAVDAGEAVVVFTRGGVLGAIPLGGNVIRYISTRPDISKALPDDLNITRVIWRSSFHISFRHVETMQRGAVYLAGDAAHVHSPAGARGMNLGIEDAAWLAWLISEARMQDYSAARMPIVRMVLEQTKQQTDGLVKLGAVGRFMRDHVAPAALGIPPLRRTALKRITGLDSDDPPWL